MHRIRTWHQCNLRSTIWVLVAQWLERLSRNQKVAGSSPVEDSDTFSEHLSLMNVTSHLFTIQARSPKFTWIIITWACHVNTQGHQARWLGTFAILSFFNFFVWKKKSTKSDFLARNFIIPHCDFHCDVSSWGLYFSVPYPNSTHSHQFLISLQGRCFAGRGKNRRNGDTSDLA